MEEVLARDRRNRRAHGHHRGVRREDRRRRELGATPSGCDGGGWQFPCHSHPQLGPPVHAVTTQSAIVPPVASAPIQDGTYVLTEAKRHRRASAEGTALGLTPSITFVFSNGKYDLIRDQTFTESGTLTLGDAELTFTPTCVFPYSAYPRPETFSYVVEDGKLVLFVPFGMTDDGGVDLWRRVFERLDVDGGT
jgi:hypothetical protein